MKKQINISSKSESAGLKEEKELKISEEFNTGENSDIIENKSISNEQKVIKL